MMNNDPDAAGDPWRCCYNNAGEAAATAVPTSGETGSFFADKAPDYSTDDLFELVWEQEGQDGGASGPAVSRLRSRRFSNPPPDVRFEPPSEDEMAAWLISAIVKGDELVCNDDGGRQPMADDSWDVPMMGTTATATNKKQKVTPEGKMGTEEMRKAPAGGSSRSHHGEAHNLTEKRRRHKINERLKTLQQLVPGCSKSNQASTLDQTIHYMKSLQHQVQAMSVGLASPAVYPVVQPQCVPPATPVAMPFPAAPMFLGGHPPSTTMMVPFGTTMIPLPHYPAGAVMMPGAAVAPLYPASAPTTTAVAPGDAVSASHLHGFSSRSSSKGSGMGSSSLCQSDRT
ncbi:hypothetical protein SORBI_3008G154000 [Sorghum bicolor]|uniref:BHLH domain-containing protein n=2 Tax=Sorghum bicolor TaxID=4558 RepID=A0A1Z5R7F3_SORBI|nr:hypothetical protein SORBI_3008G154000 [Sorghum bicolor]